jgi:hypothetical protein
VRPYLEKKKKSQKKAGGVAQGVGPEFKPQYRKILKTTTLLSIICPFIHFIFGVGMELRVLCCALPLSSTPSPQNHHFMFINSTRRESRNLGAVLSVSPKEGMLKT